MVAAASLLTTSQSGPAALAAQPVTAVTPEQRELSAAVRAVLAVLPRRTGGRAVAVAAAETSLARVALVGPVALAGVAAVAAVAEPQQAAQARRAAMVSSASGISHEKSPMTPQFKFFLCAVAAIGFAMLIL